MAIAEDPRQIDRHKVLTIVRWQCVLRLSLHDSDANLLEHAVGHVRSTDVDLFRDLTIFLPCPMHACELRERLDAVAVELLAHLQLEVTTSDLHCPVLLGSLRALKATLGRRIGFGWVFQV